MSFYSITKCIFSNKEYNAIIAWYDKTSMATNPNIWKEFVSRVKPKEKKDSFEYKENLYEKKSILTKLQTIYTKSSEICSLYPKAVEVWMKENYIYSTPLSFLERETLIKKESDIHIIYSYLTLAEKYKLGLESFLNDHRKIDTNTIDGRKSVLEESAQIEHRHNTFNQVDKLKEKYPFGFESYKEEHSLKNLKSYQNALRISNSEYEIKKRNKVILEYYEILDTYKDGLASYLQEHKNINTNTFKGKESIVNNKAVIQYKNSILKEYHKIVTKYKEELECYLRSHSNININSYEGIAQIVSSKDRIISIRETFTKFQEIIQKYPDAYNVFLEENAFVNPDTFEGKTQIVSGETEIQSINSIMGKFQSLEIHKNMLSGYICFFNLTFVPIKYPYPFQKQAFEHRKEIRNLQNCIQIIKSFKTLYPKAYPFLLEAFEDPDLKMYFKDNPVLRLKRSEIQKISQMHLEMQITEDYISKSKEFGNKSLTTEVVKDFTGEGIEKKRDYLYNIDQSTKSEPILKSTSDSVKTAILSSFDKLEDKYEEFQRQVRKIKTFKNKYPNVYPLLLQAFEDLDLIEEFKDDPVLRLKRSEIKRISQMKEELQVTEEFIIVSKEFKKSAVDYITGFVDVMDFSENGTEKKRHLLYYNEQFRQVKFKPAIELNCDLEDKNTKVRCILNSELYGDSVKFVDTYSINEFYGLASRIKGYGKTFDEIELFRKKNSKAVKSYNEKYHGKYAFFVNDFDLIGSNDHKLISWINDENNREQELKNAREKVNKIKANYPNGYKIFIDKVGYSESNLTIEQFNTIINSEYTIYEYEIIQQATQLMNSCPDATFEVLGISCHTTLNATNAKKILDAKSKIVGKQTAINIKRIVEQEQKNKINEAKNLATSYPNGFSKYFPNTSLYNINYQKANEILSYRTQIINIHNFINRINNAVSGWGDIKGIPYYYFYHYYPTRFTDVTSASREVRGLIYNFKDGSSHSKVLSIVKQKLNSTFYYEDLESLCFVCIPASTVNDNNCRYRNFSRDLCEELDMYNGFEYIKITKEKSKSHLGGTDSAEYYLDGSFFNGKYVILFDDVVTRGRSMKEFKQLLENKGATVICALSIGRTYSDYYGDNREPHPWSGEY